MKIQLYSDLHVEFADFKVPNLDSDIVIFAGDIHVKEKSIQWILEQNISKPILFILGNHEYYGKSYPKHIQTLKDLTFGTNITILEDEAFEFMGFRFLGATLWTDYKLMDDPRFAGEACQRAMSDHRLIKLSSNYSKIRSIDLAAIHNKSFSWLKNSLIERDNSKTIVISHHAPSLKSILPEYKTDIITSAFASNLDEFIEEYSPKYWFHGHTHNSSNYYISKTNVIANPRGYPGEFNKEFDDNMIIEI